MCVYRGDHYLNIQNEVNLPHGLGESKGSATVRVWENGQCITLRNPQALPASLSIFVPGCLSRIIPTETTASLISVSGTSRRNQTKKDSQGICRGIII